MYKKTASLAARTKFPRIPNASEIQHFFNSEQKDSAKLAIKPIKRESNLPNFFFKNRVLIGAVAAVASTALTAALLFASNVQPNKPIPNSPVPVPPKPPILPNSSNDGKPSNNEPIIQINNGTAPNTIIPPIPNEIKFLQANGTLNYCLRNETAFIDVQKNVSRFDETKIHLSSSNTEPQPPKTEEPDLKQPENPVPGPKPKLPPSTFQSSKLDALRSTWADLISKRTNVHNDIPSKPKETNQSENEKPSQPPFTISVQNNVPPQSPENPPQVQNTESSTSQSGDSSSFFVSSLLALPIIGTVAIYLLSCYRARPAKQNGAGSNKLGYQARMNE